MASRRRFPGTPRRRFHRWPKSLRPASRPLSPVFAAAGIAGLPTPRAQLPLRKSLTASADCRTSRPSFMPVPSPSGFVRRWPAAAEVLEPAGRWAALQRSGHPNLLAVGVHRFAQAWRLRLLGPRHSRRGQRSRSAADPAALRRTDLEPAAPLGYRFAAAGLRSAGVQP